MLPQPVEASFSFFRTVSHHIAPDTLALLDQEAPDFIPSVLWPPNSSDLNPVDYTVWSVLQERVYRTKISDVDELKRRINSEWAALSHTVIECYVLLASGISIYAHALAFMLKADIEHVL